MPVLSTERLRLRELTVADTTFVIELLNDPSFLANIGDRGVRTPADAEAYVRNGPGASYRAHGFGLYCVESTESGAPFGICGLVRRDSLPDVDIGFAFLPRYQSHGYAIEAARAVLGQARGLGLRRLVAITKPDNQPSIRLLEKLGLRFEQMITLPHDPEPLRLYAIAF